ncbi:MAG: LysR family transcriptional regulator [Bacteriovoracaceae bacterium]|nr:LysR family transcriptional regulator [Bacteriovoracaceae bacterium]
MTLTQLEYVLAVNKFRHFGKAAASCHVTQPTLSMQLQKLEDELQVIIFDRSKSPILPTNEGVKIIKQAKSVILEHKKIYDIIKSSNVDLEGDFKLAVIPTLAPYIVPLFAKNFVNKYPKINLIIEESKTEDIVQLLDNDEIDAGLLVTPLHEDSVIERVLCYEPFYLFVAPNHPFNTKSKIRENELELADTWLLNEGHCFRDQVLNICSSKQSTSKIKGNIQFESGNFETLKNMVLKYSGYTLLPHMAVSQLPSNRKTLIKEFVKPIPTREISLVHSRMFLKEKIIIALEKEIINSVPKDLKSLKKGNIEVIEIY